MKQEQLKVAVTGGSGFIGRHVLAALLEYPVKLTATYRGEDAPMIAGDQINWVAFDLAAADAKSFETLGKPDVLIHLAWGGLPHYRSDHHVTEELALQSYFLERMLEAGLSHLTIVGTCFEYGMVEGELSETQALRPHLAYGEAKVRLLREVEAFQQRHDFTLTWARLFYLFGEGQAKTSLYSQFMAALAADEPVFNMSGGEQERDFLAVGEAACKITRLALLKENCGAVNICSGRPTKVRTLVEGWRQEKGASIALNLGYYPYPDYEAMAFWGSDHKLRALLGRS